MECILTMAKLRLLTNSIRLYFIGKKLISCKSNLEHHQKTLPLTHSKLIKLSNNYQKLTDKWVITEKKILFLRAFIRMKRNNHF